MDINKLIEAEILLRNNAPVADFDDLSPTNFHAILYDPYAENSPVNFQKIIDNDTLDKISLFRVAENFIKIIDREKFIKLTPLGALPKKVMVELYDKKFIYDHMIEVGITKLWREEDCIAIMSVKIVSNLAGITKKANGKLTLTKKGISFLHPDNRQAFFELFIKTFADKFNWGCNDGYPENPIGQIGWTFTIYLLAKYGADFQPDRFYAEKYLKALSKLIEALETDGLRMGQDQYRGCYRLRGFERFLEWFGLIEVQNEGRQYIARTINIKSAEILTKVFHIDL